LNYAQFSQTNYFDKQGIFISIVFSAPLLCIALLMLFLWIAQTCDLLVKVKRMQIENKKKSEAKKQQQQQKNDNADDGGSSKKKQE